MDNIELKRVNFEQAKTLKELGFPQGLLLVTNEYLYYSDNIDKNCEDSEMIDEPFNPYRFETSMYNYYRAPYLEEVANWIESEYKLFIEVRINSYSNKKPYYSLDVINTNDLISEWGFLDKVYSKEYYTSKDNALIAGINFVISTLKNKKDKEKKKNAIENMLADKYTPIELMSDRIMDRKQVIYLMKECFKAGIRIQDDPDILEEIKNFKLNG